MSTQDFGVKFSSPGKSVFTKNPLELLFNSNRQALKIVASGPFTISVPALGKRQWVTIDHGLGYTPAFLVFVQLSGDPTVSYPAYCADLFSGSGEDCYAEANKDILEIGMTTNGTAYVAQGMYYLFTNRVDA